MKVAMRGAGAVAWRHLYKWVKMPANFLPTVLFPLVFFTAFAGGLSAAERIKGFSYPPGYTSFQYCFSLLQSAVFGGMATGFSIGSDFGTGFARRLMLVAPNRMSILVGYLASTFVRWMVIAAILTSIGLVSGMKVPGSAAELLLVFVLTGIMNLAGTCWAAGVMFRGRSVQYAPAMQVPFFTMMFMAPVMVPVALLEGWIHDVAEVNPITYVLEEVRGLLAGEPVHTAIGFACAIGMLAAFAVWAVTGLRRAERAG